MKICFLAAANSTHSHRWVKYFAKRGHQVHWISLLPPDSDPAENVNLLIFKRTGKKLIDAFLCIPFVRTWVKRIQPDVLHAHYIGTYGLIGALAGFRPLFLTAWGSDILFGGKSLQKSYFIRYALKKADIITCDALHMMRAMRSLGAEEKRIHLIRFGIDTELFSPGVPANGTIRQRLGLGNARVVISLRNHEPVYDLATLIRSVPLVISEAPETYFVIAGAGTQTEHLKKLAAETGVAKRLLFVGRIPNEEIPEYLRVADIYVSTSLSDAGIAASTAEAMSCGLPVVVTDSGENREWIEDGKSGFIVPLSDPKALAERIVLLIRDEALRKSLGQTSRKIIMERNNYYIEMGRMEKLYSEAIDHG